MVEADFLARGQHDVLGMVADEEGFDGSGALAKLPQVVEILQVHLLLAGSHGLQFVVEAAGNRLIIGRHDKGQSRGSRAL